MQRSWLRAAALFAASSTLAMGCNDVGTCDDPLNGRVPVKVGPDVMYAGQAIINTSCANRICHASTAKGATRRGAPEGLDFDLVPKAPGAPIMEDGGIVAVQLNNTYVAELRRHQRIVFDNRELIWDQVEKGLMPPEDSFKNLMSVFGFWFDSKGACPQSENLQDLESAKKELRNWLACGTPIVETSSPELPFVYVAPDSDAGAPEREVRAIAYAGSVGYQFPTCSDAPAGDGGAGPSFQQIYTNVIQKQAYACLGCHTGSASIGGLDLGSASIAYMNLVGASAPATKCSASTMVNNKRPMVTPGDPANSYLMSLLGGMEAGPACELMPQGTNGIDAADLTQVRQWIMAGAMP